MLTVLFLFLIVLSSVAADYSSLNISELTAGDPSLFKADPEVLSLNLNASSYGWTEYKQCDSRWSSEQLGTCSSTTICSAGCAMSSVAMILATKGCSYTPSTLNSWLKSHSGYANGCDIYWGSVDKLGCTAFQAIETASETEICNGLKAGHGIVANVNGGSHWVLLTACLGNGVFAVNDPGYSKTSYTKSEILREAVYH
mmetsp:Transcript_30034/g.41248  ORF Transcript_30034/g.41248 Transcript_30034/m.41248 type:complete len:199 (+) Transcript_30034:39-635(+)